MSGSELLFTAKRFRVELVSRVGGDGQVHYREVVRHPGAVTILPLVDDGHVCLIRNYRLAVGRALVELPAGTLEPGEDPATTAVRELTEETGYRADAIEHLRSFYLSPGILDERMHLYVASGLTKGPAAREAGEEIENVVVPWNDAVAMALDGRIEDAKSIIGLLYYDRLRG
jgi:ADP-ribose pyrophosphatase